ncbi:uncharacterized protein BDR25DRAFT_112874 [Lindgomyces ingoldianus]|uniref:Uncharacterized protein n=1 Tax=Lindgomyces ingoldianus TaxID=673940 RepID=A0ACB6R6M7_9PLEO|nr:uncharacterized protein BDR25DRAFT_112874 [Lindgomyces ingoldianus]KAF2474894.1 hypothetical protein BDR25DRAFT_112874 [Lindgomyces ingoldianus]
MPSRPALTKPKPKLQSQTLPTISHLPRELVDTIITTLIQSYAHDPAHQWTHLRHITRFHKTQLEKHFLNFWLPKLIITVYSSESTSVDYRAWSVSKPASTDSTARFKGREGWKDLDDEERMYWADNVWNSTRMLPSVHVRLGVGELGEGYAGGYIISDVEIPGLRTSGEGSSVWFRWMELFDCLFREEMVMRNVQGKLVSMNLVFVNLHLFLTLEIISIDRSIARSRQLHGGEAKLQFQTQIHLLNRLNQVQSHITAVKSQKAWPNTKPAQRAALIDFLRTEVQLRRRDILRQWRKHNPPRLPALTEKYWDPKYKPYVQDNHLRENPPDILAVVAVEESMVFTMKGWRNWDVCEIARLRAREAKWECRDFDRGWREKRVVTWRERRKEVMQGGELELVKKLKVCKRWPEESWKEEEIWREWCAGG